MFDTLVTMGAGPFGALGGLVAAAFVALGPVGAPAAIGALVLGAFAARR